ncbi:MAG: dUTP diphosphatase [Propionibacterium sp.]|nr:MAG: dUTP diphosphatase [Propionibacterium sp.]
MQLPWKRLADGQVPSYALPGDAGADLCSAQQIRIAPGQRQLVNTGVAVAIPAGYVGLITPRSGLAHKLGLGMVNAPGVIDSGYRGELKINLINHDLQNSIEISVGDRIAQLLLMPVAQAEFIEVDSFETTLRGEAGHGSTGGASSLINS